MDQYQLLTSDKNEYHPEFRDLIDLVLQQSGRYADKTAYVLLDDGTNESRRISFSDLEKDSLKVAAYLQNHYQKGDRCILLFPSGIDFIVALLGTLMAGLIAVPAYPPRRNRNAERFWSILRDCDASAILASDGNKRDLLRFFGEDERLPVEHVFQIQEVSEHEPGWKKPGILPDDTAILQYTSGSTGEPRGVMVSHRNILNNFAVVSKSFGHDESLVGVNWLPNYHDMGLFGTTLQTLYRGGTSYIIPPQAFIKDPAAWLKSVSRYRAQTIGCPNFGLDYCCEKISEEDKQQIDLSSVRVFFCGAEPIHKQSLDRFRQEFSNCGFREEMFYPTYGLAEATLMVSGGDYRERPVYFSARQKAMEARNELELSAKDEAGKDIVACGFPWLGNEILVVDPENGNILKEGTIGEIWTSGPSVCKGYWKKEEATKAVFKARIAGSDKRQYLRTGDLGFIFEGQLYISGRRKDMIIIRGQNYYPQDIERIAESSHDAVRDYGTAAFAINKASEERLVIVAEIERTYMRHLQAPEIFTAIRESIAREFELQVYAIVLIKTGSLPRTTSGKIQHRASKLAFLDNELDILAVWEMDLAAEYDAISIELENLSEDDLRQWLIHWLSRKVKIAPETIDPGRSMFSYGMDSIAAVELEREAREIFGIEWSLPDFLEDNRINHLAEISFRMLQDK
ncbi:MAG: AMP-binding protein [Bacteroidota bacterium]|nr:AMP-binding protein [Bacteroidota bacterium]